jgi:hypothetical protein
MTDFPEGTTSFKLIQSKNTAFIAAPLMKILSNSYAWKTKAISWIHVAGNENRTSAT